MPSPEPAPRRQTLAADAGSEPESPFRRVATGTFMLHPLGDRFWLSSAEDGTAFAELRGQGFVRDETLAHGVQRCAPWDRLALTATHADDLWLFDDFHPWSACPPPARLFRSRQGGPWKLQGALRAHWVAMGPWKKGSTLIAEVPLRSGPPWGYTLRSIGAARAPVPKQWSRAPKSGECWTELEAPLALFSNAAGEALVVAASRCIPSAGAPAEEEPANVELAIAERFDKDGTSARTPLPVALDSNSTVLGHGPHAVWAIGTDAQDRTALVASAARGFEIIDHPPAGTALLDVDPDGSVWALHDGALQRRAPTGAWQRVALPAGAEGVLGLHATSAEDVWLVLESGVYRTLPTEPFAGTARACTDEEAARLGERGSVQSDGEAAHAVARSQARGPHSACSR